MAIVVEPAETKGAVKGCFYQPSIDSNDWITFRQCGYESGPFETRRRARRDLHAHVATHIRYEDTREIS